MSWSLALRPAALLLVVAAALVPAASQAAAPRVLPPGKQPADARLAEPKDLNGYFPMQVPKTAEAWRRRAAEVRRQIQVSQGIWPQPERTPLNAVIHGRIDKGDYTVEKVFFESVPGFFVTGNLYRPKDAKGPAPGVLFAHGHWNQGRFIDIGRQAVRKEIVTGSERFEEGGRSLLQALPVQVARMGCVCFHYDMIGYADSVQLSFELAHRFAKQRAEMNDDRNWGLFSPQAEAHLQSIMGLQTWNSVRAMDFLLSLPEVDPARIAMTGASGGGTQTMLLAAIDPRISLSFPAVMVSTAMQGGCTCENASLLRVGTGNIEFASLFAPKPQGTTAANDWTKEMAAKGFPEIKALYKLLGAEKNVELFAFTHFPHNYNYVSRSAFYNFLNKHFKLGLENPVVEEDYQRLTTEQMTVWDEQHPRPPSGPEFERKLCRQLYEAAQKQLADRAPKDAASLAAWREVVGGALAVIAGRAVPAAADVEFEKTEETPTGDAIRFAGLLRNCPHQEELPVAFLHPKDWNGRVVVWLSEQGKAGMLGEEGSGTPQVRRLLAAGIAVAGIDLFQQGEFLSESQSAAKNRPVKNTREFAGYTYGYNHALLAQRVHDVLTLVTFIKHNDQNPKSIELVAVDGTAPVVALAAAQAGDLLTRAAIDTRGFRFGKVNDYLDANFLPGGARYGDLPGLVSLTAPTKLWLAGETAESAALVKAAYGAAGAADALTLVEKGSAAEAVNELVMGH